jgi:hypothetical protein
MTKEISERILYLCGTIPQKLAGFPEEEMAAFPAPGKWSKKEILGHLIDSAASNHQRFVRWQYDESPMLYYSQNDWVTLQDYRSENSADIIRLWESYNRHLAHIIACLPESALQRVYPGRDGHPISLSFLVEDYLSHLEHHLKQIFKTSSYETF